MQNPMAYDLTHLGGLKDSGIVPQLLHLLLLARARGSGLLPLPSGYLT